MLLFCVGFLAASIVSAVVYFIVDRKIAKDPSRGSGTLFVNDTTGEVYAEFDRLDGVEVMELGIKRI